MKVGMHIDAVLEFAVEYPLQWNKDRRLAYGRNAGEVRWSHPVQSGTVLQVASSDRKSRTNAQELDLVLREYPDLTETTREQVELPAGDTWHVSGRTAQQQVDIYLLLQPDRTYVITFKASPENFADYKTLMDKVIQSFQRIAQ